MHPRKERKKPILPIRMVMQFASFVLCLLLVVSLDATVLVEDLQVLTSSGGIHTVLTALITPSADTTDPALLLPSPSSNNWSQLNSTTTTGGKSEEGSGNESGYTVDENGNIIAPDGSIVGNVNDPSTIPDGVVIPGGTEIPGNVELPADFEIPSDILTNPDSLTNFIYEVASEMMGEDANITVEQVQTFVSESTITEFVAEKAETLINEVLTGEITTIITAEDVMNLIEENEALLEETFQFELTEEAKAEMHTKVEQAIAEADVDNAIRNSVEDVMHTTVPGAEGMEVGDLMSRIEWFTHVEALVDAIIVCVVLVGLIMLANYYNLPRGLGWTAAANLIAGIVLSIPLIVIHVAPSVLGSALPANLLQVLNGVYSIMAPYHYAVLIVGVVLSIGSIAWGIVKKKHAVYA